MSPLTESEAREELARTHRPSDLTVDAGAVLTGGHRLVRRRRLQVAATAAVVAALVLLTPKLLGRPLAGIAGRGAPLIARFEPSGVATWGCEVRYTPGSDGGTWSAFYLRPDGSSGPDVAGDFPALDPTHKSNTMDWGVPVIAGIAPSSAAKLWPVDTAGALPADPVVTKALGDTGVQAFCLSSGSTAAVPQLRGFILQGTDGSIRANDPIYTESLKAPDRTLFVSPALGIAGIATGPSSDNGRTIRAVPLGLGSEVFVELDDSGSTLNSALPRIGILPAGAHDVVVSSDTGQTIPATATDIAGTAYAVVRWNASTGQVIGTPTAVAWTDSSGTHQVWRSGHPAPAPAYLPDQACDLYAAPSGPSLPGAITPTTLPTPMTRDQAIAAARERADGGSSGPGRTARAAAVKLPYEATRPTGVGSAARAPLRCTWAVTVEAPWTPIWQTNSTTAQTQPFLTVLFDAATGEGIDIHGGPGTANYVTGTGLPTKSAAPTTHSTTPPPA